MFGEPPDTDDACNARLFIGDNYGDGTATMRCQLPPNHGELHREQFERKGGTVTITWVADERERCDHGCGQWDHAHGSPYDDNAIQCPKDADDHEYSDCTHCHPEDQPLTCGHCAKTHYYEEGHLRHCAMKPFTCAICGESGVGNHDWPSGCPKQREMLLARGVADEFALEDSLPPSAAPPSPDQDSDNAEAHAHD
jgi:hypothetical protein